MAFSRVRYDRFQHNWAFHNESKRRLNGCNWQDPLLPQNKFVIHVIQQLVNLFNHLKIWINQYFSFVKVCSLFRIYCATCSGIGVRLRPDFAQNHTNLLFGLLHHWMPKK